MGRSALRISLLLIICGHMVADGEVKVCDKAQRFDSIANGSPLNEARRGALNPDGGTFLGENGQIENHVCL